MKRRLKRPSCTAGIIGTSFVLAAVAIYLWWFHPSHERIRSVTYGHRGEQKLLLDVFRPPKQNVAAVVVRVSGSWKSGSDKVPIYFLAPFLQRGYTVFAVQHLSQPQCLIGDIVDDMHRAIRFIRHNASTYGIDPSRIGVVGARSGGHLSLMLATCGKPGPADAVDVIDQQPVSSSMSHASSRQQTYLTLAQAPRI